MHRSLSPRSIITNLHTFLSLSCPSASGRLKAALILQMLRVSPVAGMSKYLHTLSEMSYFYDLENPGISSVPDGILQDTWNLLKLHKTGIIPGKPERIRILFTSDK